MGIIDGDGILKLLSIIIVGVDEDKIVTVGNSEDKMDVGIKLGVVVLLQLGGDTNEG